MKKIVSLCRCSTVSQSFRTSIQTQEKDLDEYIEKEGVIEVKRFIEVGSGAKKRRPVLQEALDLAKKEDATLVVARFDRIGRRQSQIARILESKVEFLALDYPEANTLVLNILGSVAAYESQLVSARVKKAIAYRKSQGKEWGSFGKNLAKINRKQATDWATTIEENVKRAILSTRKPTYKRIADKLNAFGVKTRNDKNFHATTVRRVMQRLDITF